MRVQSLLLFSSLCIGCFAEDLIINGSFTRKHLEQLKNDTRELFEHGWDSYMKYGYPADEVRPLSCEKYERVPDVLEINRNDVLGNYSITFLDTLTTFAIFGDIDKFSEYIEKVRNIDFNSDATVQVFETTIRALGSLLSCHLYAMDEFKLNDYDGFLLLKAKELGNKLLTAYRGKNGLPLPRINLNGDLNLPETLLSETCTAGAASPMLELTLLSILTNDTRYEEYSRSTYLQLWNSRSDLDLIPMTLNPVKGLWMDSITGIGASIDSFYEYALKGSILFNDDDLAEVWERSIKALLTHSKLEWFFPNVDTTSGMIVSPWIDALGAFFPGLLVLAGQLENAIKSHLPYIKLWNQYGGIPERWDFFSSKKNGFSTGKVDPVSLEWYPLRPEFIESTYYLYRATLDPLYLRIGEQILNQYKYVFKSKCGFSGFHDVRTKERQDRMETFVLSETLMYLYLLFDEGNNLNHKMNYVFSTEGHPFWIPKNVLNGYNEYKYRLYSSINEEDHANSATTKSKGLTTLTKRKRLTDLINDFKNWNKDELQLVLDYLLNFFGDEEEENIEELLPIVLDQVSFLNIKQDNEEFEIIQKNVCEIYTPENLFFSNLLSDPNLFILDSKFRDQWNFTKEGSIELEPSFYEIYSTKDLICNREPNSSIMDSIIGNHSHIKDTNNIKYFNHNTEHDIWVKSIDGIRLKLELLKINTIDSENNLVEEEFITKYQSFMQAELDGFCLFSDEKLSDGVLKILTINGIPVNDKTVYIPESSLTNEFIKKNSIQITNNNHFVLHKLVVSNMKTINSTNIY